MDILVLVALVALAWHLLKTGEQKQRIALLGRHLGAFQIEKLMEALTQGYQRALGEADAGRQAQVWQVLRNAEQQLAGQFQRFAADFAQVDPAATRVSRWPVAVPYATRLFPAAAFDAREVFAVHARGLAEAAADGAGRSDKERAFTLSAEMLLMQHTCHRYCRSKAVASARLLARHQTTYVQALAAVSPATREAYLRLVGGTRALTG